MDMKLNFKLMRKELRFSEQSVLKLFSIPLLTLLAVMLSVGVSAQDGSVINPCSCMSNQTFEGNGQFEATIRVTDGGAGPWTISSVSNFFEPSSPAPPASPDLFTVGTAMTLSGGGVFELTGIHIDGVGFDVEVTDGTDTIPISVPPGQCQYPKTQIYGDPFVCEGQEVIYSTPNDPGSTYLWTLTNGSANGGVITSPNNNNSVSVLWDDDSDGATHTLAVRETSSNGCVVVDEMQVVIEDTITLACNDLVQVSVDVDCGGGLVADLFLEGQIYDDEAFSLVVQDSDGNVLSGIGLSESMIGNEYMVTIIHDCTGMQCMSRMLVLDKQSPQLKCHADTIKCYQSIDPFDLASGFPILDKDGTPLPKSKIRKVPGEPRQYIAEGSSSCTDVTLRYYDEKVEEGCLNKDFSYTIYRNWIATDESGNLSACQDTIKMTRVELKDITYPQHWDGLPGHKPFIQACSDYKKDHNGNPHPDLTGSPIGDLCGDFMISYSDHKRIPLCGVGDNKSYKVLREWTVMDNCDPNKFFDTIQVIAIMDTKKPQVNIPGLIEDSLLVVEAEYYDCGASIRLPSPKMEDCSKVGYNIYYQFADENGDFVAGAPYVKLNKTGFHYVLPNIDGVRTKVKYVVFDICGNTTEKIFYVEVVDNLLPQAICDKHTSVTLDELGESYMIKESLDDGSYDNCSDVTLLIRRDNSCNPSDVYWGEGVHFCCEDTRYDSVMVELQVKDAEGNTNTCMGWVKVHDLEKPTIQCPKGGQVSCKFDYSDLSVFGTVRKSQEDVQNVYITDPENGGYHYFGTDGFASDNCLFDIEELPPYKSIDNCGRGYIIRKFRAIDGYGNYSNICTQRIDVVDFEKFGYDDIDWPNDITLQGCLSDDLIDPDSLPEGYGWPRLLGEDQCSMVAMDYEDLVFSHIDDENICYKVLRTWRILDECNYEPNGDAGYWEKAQVIMLNETEAPVIESGCTPVDIVAAGDCQYKYIFRAKGYDNCSSEGSLRWSYKVNINNSVSDVVEGEGNQFDVILSKGTHKVTWTVKDECGNESSCTKLFTVEDTKKPTPLCITTLVTVLLGDEGQVTINAADFNHNSFDDCTRSNYGTCGCLTDLRFSFSENVNNRERVLTCSDIVNGISDTVELKIYVTDESGNQDFCNTNIILQDNGDYCDDVVEEGEIVYHNIFGAVTTSKEEPIPGVKVDLISESTEVISESVSDVNGAFEFENIEENSNYTISTEMDGDYLNGLTTLDLVLIQKHILDIQKLDSPYKLIAADANNSGSITAADILVLRKLILGVTDDIHSNTPWVFIDKDFVFENDNNPFDFSRIIEVNDIVSDIEKNIIGIKTGDVNISANVSADALESRSEDVVYLMADEKQFVGGDNVSVPIYIGESTPIVGMQFTIKYNPFKLSFDGISEGAISVTESNINIAKQDEGIVTFSWNLVSSQNVDADKELFVVNFRSIEAGNISEALTVNSELTRAEIYTVEGSDIDENTVQLKYRGVNDNVSFELLQNRPNPFSDKTTIEFTIPKTQMANFTVYDVSGRVLYAVEKEFQKGRNTISLTRKDLNEVQGVLYFKLETETNSASRKMILIR